MSARLLAIPTMHYLARLRRLATIGLMLSSLLTALTSRPEMARAAEDPAAQAPTVSSCSDGSGDGAPLPSIPLAGGVASAHRVAEGLAWDVRFIVDADTAFDFRGGALFFAVPLPAGERMLPTDGVSELMEGDRVVGLCVARHAIHDRTVSSSFVQPVALGDATTPLGVPVAAGSTVQILETSLGEARLDVTTGGVLEKHVGFVAARGVGHDAREEARRLGNVQARIDTSPVYVRGEDVRAMGGLSARLIDPQARSRGGVLGVFLLFAGVVGALAFAARRLHRTANVERVDALLASEIDDASRTAPARAREERA
jgi:hypothetical protein